ncbi:MAG: (Fe-S)-binding protein [Gammaproteobacteria bacterium]
MVFLIVTAIGFLAGLTLLLATLLVIAGKAFYIEEDLRVKNLSAMLPQTNCGACGYAGCRAFAEALIEKETEPGRCTQSSEENLQLIAAFLGVAAARQEKRVARLACAGGDNVARFKARYLGIQSCRAAAQVAGGGKSCAWGCLGFGDCEAVCDYDAIRMDLHHLPTVDEERCTACGDCVEVCPKDLFSLHPVSHRLWVACKNLEKGDEILEDCEVACTGCGLCAADAPNTLIVMRNNLPEIDYSKDHGIQGPIQRCPTGAIVWIDADGTFRKGPKAKRIVRKEPLQPTVISL